MGTLVVIKIIVGSIEILRLIDFGNSGSLLILLSRTKKSGDFRSSRELLQIGKRKGNSFALCKRCA